ncbi:MAG: ABC transporter permease [Planctomycetota bacterium]
MSDALAPPPLAPAADAKPSTPPLSQWQLIRRRFARHRIAVVALHVLVVFYLVALFAGFIAPHGNEWRDLDRIYAPPMVPSFSFTDGLHATALKLDTDKITFAKTYRFDHDAAVPLGFFVEGEPYRLWGLIPMDTHLFGVDRERWAESHPGQPPPSFYLCGADRYGRDIFSRIVHGARISLSVGLVAIVITFFLGLTIGGISGYVGGKWDVAIQRLIEIVNSFPHLPLWLAIAAVLPSDWSALQTYFGITIVLSLLNWTGLARVVRGKILSLREEDYVVAARLVGASHRRIIGVHLIPGFTSHIIVSLTIAVPSMILGETALSFLGLGLRPPIVSWGVLLQDCLDMTAVANYPWMLLPVIPIIFTVLCFNFLGDGLRDAADPYSGR